MSVLKFKITEDNYDVVREIEIKPNTTIQAFAEAISKYFDLSKKGIITLFETNDAWKKIKAINLDYDKTSLLKTIQNPYQTYVLSHDAYPEYVFHAVLVTIKDDENKEYPFCLHKEGNLPHFKNILPGMGSVSGISASTKEKETTPKKAAALQPVVRKIEEEDFDDEDDDDETESDEPENTVDAEDDDLSDEQGFGVEGEEENNADSDDFNEGEDEFGFDDSSDFNNRDDDY